MKVLVVGSGGREHAICWKISQSPKVDKIYCAPGNAGISQIAECVDIKAMEFDKLVAFAKEKNIDLVKYKQSDEIIKDIEDYVLYLIKNIKFTKNIEIDIFNEVTKEQLKELFERYDR